MSKIEQKNLQTIEVKSRYASQTLTEIPVGYWIDKSVGGCGLSYLCLTDANDSIIIMPRISLIENKIQQTDKYNNLFKVISGVSQADVYKHIKKCKSKQVPVKILTTYDSFALGKLDYLLKDKLCRVYVDESQFVLSFARENPVLAIELHKRLEDNIQNVTFFSAHPPKRDYLPEYIQSMPAIKYIWKHQIKATPYTIDTNKPYLMIGKILKELVDNKECAIGELKFKKAIVFFNSMEGLKKIAEIINSKENTAYVVGDTLRNDSKLNDYAYRLEDCSSLPLITLGTTSLISGFDLYDNDTINIVVSTSSKTYTLMDKELDVPQAITRQRNDGNIHNDKFIFIVDVKDMDSKAAKLKLTYQKDYKKLKTVVENLNYLKEGNKDYSVGYELYEGYYFLHDDVFHVNESMLKARMYIFEQLYKQYKEGYNVMSTNTSQKLVKMDIKKYSSKQYADYATDINNAVTLEDKKNIIASITNKKWRELLSYGVENQKVLLNITDAKVLYDSRADYKSIVVAINKLYKLNTFYASSDIKTQLQELYNKKSLKRTAKATDLYEFFDMHATCKNNRAGYILTVHKFLEQ